MESSQPTGIVSDERQQVLEHNVYASAINSQQQADLLRRIAGDVAVIKWAALAGAALLLFLVLR